MIDQIGYWVLVALGFGFLIFIHELGHFAAARFVGIRIVRFAIGFGPRLFGTNKNADNKDHDKRTPGTDYCLCLIPCGGYVKMAGGEGEGDSEVTGAPDEFPSKTPGQRALVIAAGPFMSIVTAVPLLFILLVGGMDRPSSRIEAVQAHSPAWEAGLMRGDLITGIRNRGDEDWQEVRLWRDVKFNSALKYHIGNIEVRLKRGDKEMVFPVETEEDGIIGLVRGIVGGEDGYITNVVGIVPDDGEAAKAGITPGCTILEIGGRRVRKWAEWENVIRTSPGKTISVKFKTPEGKVLTSKVKIGIEEEEKEYKRLDIEAALPNIIATTPALRSRRAEAKAKKPQDTKNFFPVRPGFPAEDAELKKGDRVTAFNGVAVKNWPELKQAFATTAKIGKNTLTVVRNGKTSSVDVKLERIDNIGDGLGIAPEENPVVERATAGIPLGARLLEVTDPDSSRDPYRLDRAQDVARIPFQPNKSKSRAVTFTHEGEEKTVSVPMVPFSIGELDLSPRLDRVYVLEPGRPIASVGMAFVEAGTWIKVAGRGLRLLVTGRVSMDQISGPVMILTATKYQAEAGWSKFIEFLVIITIHLGVINLVPFPILDGGHLGFLAVEKIRRKPCPEKLMAGLMYGGMIGLLSLMLFVTWNDVTKLLNFFG